MFEARKSTQTKVAVPEIARPEPGRPAAMTLLTVVGEHARFEGKFDITDSIQIECEIAGEMTWAGSWWWARRAW